MSKYRRMYLGQSGENYVMSQFLLRGYNVAVPLIDQGDDLLVFEEGTGKYWPVQVKTASSHKLKTFDYGFSFHISLQQLASPVSPELTYIFALRHEGGWLPSMLIPRKALQHLYKRGRLGKHDNPGAHLHLFLRSVGGEIFCHQENFTKYVENWSEWPEAKGLVPSA